MNIIINQRRFLEAIKTTERVVSRNTSLPILNTILLKTDKGKLRLSATNLEVGIQYWVGAKIEKEGSIAVPAKTLSDFVALVGDEKLSINVEKNSIFISSENYKTQILGMKPDDFPITPVLSNSQEFIMKGKILADSLGKVIDAVSLLETRPELSGVYINIGVKEVAFAATDSFRLSECIVPAQNIINKAFIIPRNTALEILRLAYGKDDDFHIIIGDNQIAVRGVDVEIVSRLIDGKYPDYKKVIPNRNDTIVAINKQLLEQHSRMASIFSSNISDLVLKASHGILHVTAKNSDRGEIDSQISIPSKAQFTISVNYRYLLDALKVIDGTEVELAYTGEGSPLVVRKTGDRNHTYVIMPLRA